MNQEEHQIRSVIEDYVTGFSRADKPLLMQVLHDRFICAGFLNGDLQWDSAEEFADFCVEAAPDRDGPISDWEIETLAVAGPTAVAVVHDRWGERKFRDNLTLINDGAGWRILFKTFHIVA